MKEKVLSLEEIEKRYFEEKLDRLRKGYPLKFRRTKPRDHHKREAMIRWLLEVIPPPEEILSGSAFEELFRK